MFLDRFHLQSLKTRVSLLTLLVVVVGFLTLSFYAKGLLRDELMLYTGEQQRSALNLLTSEVEHGLRERLAHLGTVASRVSPALLDDRAALKAFLLEQSFLVTLFNSGVMVFNTSGGRQANVRFLPDGLDINPPTPQELEEVFKKGSTVIGRIEFQGTLKTPVLSMAVPIRNSLGVVIGALVGEIRLDQPSFLSQLTAHRYGKTGHFFLIEADKRLILATSDTARVMEVLPAAGISPWIDRFVAGFEGTARVLNPHGVEVLVSIKQIPMAHWYASVTLTPDEAFALIDAVKPRARLAALLLLLVSLLLLWWMLRRQLAPMTTAVSFLDGFVRLNQPPQALPVVRQDEVGQLVGGFNRLLDTLLQQQKVLQDSETLKQAVLNSVTAEIAVLDHEGAILATNDAWRRHAPAGVAGQDSPGADVEVGSNYPTACRGLGAENELSDAMAVPNGIRAVLAGRLPRFYLEYLSQSLPQQRWSSMSVTPLDSPTLRGAVVSLEDITERVVMERHVRQLAFYDPLTQLPNRRLALERLTDQLVRARRAKSRLALLFIDLDKFKPINDELGHGVGDWLLHAVAQRILGCVRASDTAARMGGDEFVVLLPDLHSSDEALAVAEKIRSALTLEFVTTQGMALSISCSIGVALYPDHGDTDKDLLRMGDEAMYRAKKAGRNAVVLCEPLASGPMPDGSTHGRHSYVHLRWKAAFGCGHPVIDGEHQQLFQLANTLLDQVPLRSQQPLAFEAAFHELLTHVTLHFAHEEAILLAHAYPLLDRHAQQHTALITQAHALFLAAQAIDAAPAAEAQLVKFLVSDLVAAHLLHDDRAFFAALAKPA